jgi:hypothetical protein
MPAAGDGSADEREGRMMCACKEPSLSELMTDPVVQAMMACDSVVEADLWRLLNDIRASFGEELRLDSRGPA